MSFVSPLFLVGLLAAALPIILHFTLRGRAPRLPFSDVRFLERAFVHRDQRRRLRELILLALRVAAIVLLALAFARPFVDAADDTADGGTEEPAAPAPSAAVADAAAVAPAEPAGPTGVLAVVNDGAIEPGALYLARALDAAPRERPFTLRVVAPDDVMAFDAAGWETTDVVVVAGTEGLSRPGQARIVQFLEEGGGLLLVAGPDVDPRLVSNLLGPSAELAIAASDEAAVRRLAVADPRHPIFRPFGDRAAALGQVRFTGAVRVTLPDGDLLASFDSGDPALIEYAAAPGRALIFASDLNDAWNDFPRRAGFVPFVHEMVRYLAAAGADAARPERAAASPDSLQPPRDEAPDAAQSLWWYAIAAVALALIGEIFLGRTMA